MKTELRRALDSGLTVAELIEELETLDPESKVVFSYDSSDYWKTRVAAVIDSVDEGAVRWSDYHRQPEQMLDEQEEGDDTESASVIVFNMKVA